MVDHGWKTVLICALATPWATAIRLGVGSGGRTIQRWKQEVRKPSPTCYLSYHIRLTRLQFQPPVLSKREDTDPKLLYPAHNLSVPVDHFHNDSLYEPHTDAKFNLRYWFDASHYKPGGPVIVLQSGETSGVSRLGFLQKGLLAQLANLTNGVGVVLEHRCVVHVPSANSAEC